MFEVILKFLKTLYFGHIVTKICADDMPCWRLLKTFFVVHFVVM